MKGRHYDGGPNDGGPERVVGKTEVIREPVSASSRGPEALVLSGSQNDIIRLLQKSSCYRENAPLRYQELIEPRLSGQGTDVRTVN